MLLFSSQEEKFQKTVKDESSNTCHVHDFQSFPQGFSIGAYRGPIFQSTQVKDADPMNLKKAIPMGHTTTKITKGGIGMLWSY